ncbi:MAG: hypothetical protein FWF31_06355 [Desulfobulbus sp.]|nr:hypothetical protein [Desulfobulbus sp.]
MLVEDRVKLREQIAATKRFEGAVGRVSFLVTGDPEKCTVLIKFEDSGVLAAHEKFCPGG